MIAHNLNGHKGALKQCNTSELEVNNKWKQKKHANMNEGTKVLKKYGNCPG